MLNRADAAQMRNIEYTKLLKNGIHGNDDESGKMKTLRVFGWGI